jgi:hypothetical protein
MQHRIALVGKSVGVKSIGASLAARGDFELLRFSGTPADVAAWIDTMAPDAVIFDIAGPCECFVIGPTWRPGLLLIGFDLCAQEMMVVSGEQVKLSTTEDLLQVLSRRRQCEVEAANTNPDPVSASELPASKA